MIYFDQSLPEMVRELLAQLPSSVVADGLFLRDAVGKLTFIPKRSDVKREARDRLSTTLAARLGAYVDQEGFAVATATELLDETLTDRSTAITQTLEIDGAQISVQVLDRRVVGADWLQSATRIADKPRIVFSSLKGGVGRSTALCVLAAALAKAGKRVLTVDLDVEAPGLGTMLLTPETQPRFGLLDYLVETNLHELDDAFLSELFAPSWLGDGSGVVDVLPALGSDGRNHPQNALAKIARAYLTPNAASETFTSKLVRLFNWVDSRSSYDVMLIDARAGLHETTGAALLGLGARVYLFGVAQAQTIAAYELLIANLALLHSADWSDRLRFVQAKASADVELAGDFSDQIRTLLASRLTPQVEYVNEVSPIQLKGVFEVAWESDEEKLEAQTRSIIDAPEAEFLTWHIIESETFRNFDPVKHREHLSPDVYEAVFGSFLRGACADLAINLEGQADA